ncbi:MAG: glycosyltransferase family 4 protein [Chloroflexi bacterium]|nr:glycosyltransferase family 4 protein [Chloroflexota bacterium]
MRIGIDATALPSQPFGAANYIVNLVQALLRVDTTNDYVIFAKPLHVPLFEKRQRVQVIGVPLATRILRIAWEQTGLPWLTQEHRLDVLHSPHYTMPFAARCATVVTFHDMTFFLYQDKHLFYKQLFFRLMIPWSARRADALIAILVRAFARVVQSGLPHSLVMAGSRGWMDTEVFSTIEELGLLSRVCFAGYVPQPDLPALYSAAELFVYPSLYEGFGLPVLEAMACGAPLVTSNVSSMPEVAGDAGLLVEPSDVDALSNAMQRVLTDRALRDTLGSKGQARAQTFSWERTARETLAVYRHVAT